MKVLKQAPGGRAPLSGSDVFLTKYYEATCALIIINLRHSKTDFDLLKCFIEFQTKGTIPLQCHHMHFKENQVINLKWPKLGMINM